MSRVAFNGIFLIFIQVLTSFGASPKSFTSDHGREGTISIGDTFFIPCDISTPFMDRTVLILLLKDQSKIPIASIDFRNGNRVKWSSEAYRGRLHLSLDSRPGGLLLKGVTSNDEGMYTCRVDFRSSPTRIMERKLIVTPPRTRVRIRVNKPFVQPTRGPRVVTVAERERLRLKCEVTSANPPPRIIWTRKFKGLNQTIRKSSLHSLPSRERSTSSKRLLSASFFFVPQFSDHEAVITCRTPPSTPNDPQTPLAVQSPKHPEITYLETPTNYENHQIFETTEISKFQETSLTSERLKLKSLETSETLPNKENTQLLNNETPHLFETSTTLDVGPSPRIPENSTFQVELKESQTLETLRITTPNESLNADETPINDFAEESIKLNVLYAPRVRVSVRNSGARVMEGDDVYLKCYTDANPPPSNIHWRRQGQELLQSSSNFILDDSRTSLLLPSVTSEVSGQYSCVATNSEGSASNELILHVWHEPRCRSGDQTLIAGLLNETVELSCDVSSFPAPTSFKWNYKFNQNSTVTYYNNLSFRSSSGTIRYRLESQQDFTTIVCAATNSLGEMEQPCAIKIVPTGPPEPVTRCVLHSQKQKTRLICVPGFHGGSTQIFTLKVWTHFNHGEEKILMEQRNSSSPSFDIPYFTSSQSITLQVIPWNCEGQGLSVNLNYSTLETIKFDWTTTSLPSSIHTNDFPFKRNGHGNFWSPARSVVGSSSAVILGVVVLSLSCSVLVLCCVRLRIRKKRCSTEVDAGIYHEKAFSSSTQEAVEQQNENERAYLTAGCLLIGVSSEGTSKSEPLEKWRLLNERKFGDDSESSEENMLGMNKPRREGSSFTQPKIEKYAHSPQRRESTRRCPSPRQVSSSSDESLSIRPESKASIVTVVFNPSK